MKNLKQIKTTILGLFFITIASVYWFSYPIESDNLILVTAYLVGILLLLAPDALIEIIKNKFK